jgi:hypothetical protein
LRMNLRSMKRQSNQRSYTLLLLIKGRLLIKYSVKVKPNSRKANFILGLQVGNNGKNRIKVSLRKLNHYYHLAYMGNINAIILTAEIADRINKTTEHFKKQKKRLQAIKNSVDIAKSFHELEFKVSSKLDFGLIRILILFDEILSCVEVGRLTGRLTNRSARLKEDYFSKKVLRIIMKICLLEYCPDDIEPPELNYAQIEMIKIAMNNKNMPILIGNVRKKIENIVRDKLLGEAV